jgi:hypothetical protein
MNTLLLQTKFTRIGARLKMTEQVTRRVTTVGVALDVKSDNKGEFFELFRRPKDDAEIDIIDVRSEDRHLLLLIREGQEKNKFLCGHDERHWFVAGIPEKAPVGTVRQAKEALKPSEVLAAEASKRLRGSDRDRRKNAAFIRQGEWFFLPQPTLRIDPKRILSNEPLRRSTGGKPHWVDECYRTGGEQVYVCAQRPAGVTEDQHRKILSGNPKARLWDWRVMSRNAGVFVRGRVRHADHATITLRGWHRVLMNTEGQSRAMRNVAFLD